MTNSDVEELIQELLADPAKFNESGRANALLNAYFAGVSTESLRPLLRSDNPLVQRSAAFIASELGSKAARLVEDLPVLLRSSDRHVLWYALEALAVCSTGRHADQFVHVVLTLGHRDEAIRRLAMRLMARAPVSQLDAACRWLEALPGPASHAERLRILLNDTSDESAIAVMMRDPDPLTRRYGAVAATRLKARYPGLASEMRSSSDPDIRSLAAEP